MTKKSNNKKKLVFVVLGIAIILLLWSVLTSNPYLTYKETIVDQQQDHLLTISKALSTSLETYFEEQLINLKLVEQSNSFYRSLLLEEKKDNREQFEKRVRCYYDDWDFVAIYLINKEGTICYKDDNGKNEYINYEYNGFEEITTETIGIDKLYEIEEDKLVMSIAIPVSQEGKQIGTLVGLLDMQEIFNKLIRDTKVAERGYVMVKDEVGTIIMHHVKEQIGEDVIKGRKDKFPQLDYSDLEELIHLQYTQKEGVAEYYSYWWNQTKINKIKKISSFSRVEIGESFWVVATVMDYADMAIPIQNNLFKLIQLTIFTIILIAVSVFSVFWIEKERRRLEIEGRYLKNINETLRELQETQKKMKHYEKLQSVETLTGGIAHEFNNLMTPILAYSQLAISTMEEENSYYEDMLEIYNGAYKAKELVKQIMLFSRRDNMETEYQIVNMAKEVKLGLNMIKVGLKGNIEIIEEIDNESGNIYANGMQIQQVLLNLCNNAIQAMDDKSGILTIKLYRLEKEKIEALNHSKMVGKEWICLEINDNGKGISNEMIKRIFDPFFTSKKVGEGTGVGLAVVKGIIKSHKGEIKVTSEVHKGTSFKIYLPIIDKEIEEKKERRIVGKRQNTILLIEDKVRVLKSIKKSLQTIGYEVKEYADATKAIAYFEENAKIIDLVITDYAMPELTGIEVANRVKEIRYDIKVLMITGFVEPEVITHITNQVIEAFVMKPIDYMELDKKIQDLLKK